MSKPCVLARDVRPNKCPRHGGTQQWEVFYSIKGEDCTNRVETPDPPPLSHAAGKVCWSILQKPEISTWGLTIADITTRMFSFSTRKARLRLALLAIRVPLQNLRHVFLHGNLSGRNPAMKEAYMTLLSNPLFKVLLTQVFTFLCYRELHRLWCHIQSSHEHWFYWTHYTDTTNWAEVKVYECVGGTGWIIYSHSCLWAMWGKDFHR